jgi:hypothetical protein
MNFADAFTPARGTGVYGFGKGFLEASPPSPVAMERDL